MLYFLRGLTHLCVFFFTFYNVLPAQAQDSASALSEPSDRVLGQRDAPITLYEYSSLTCPHCATFHTDTLPKLKENYIDTGKVRLILRDFPLDRLSLVGAMMARCAPGNRYYTVMGVLFSQQGELTRSENPLDYLKQTGRLAGMTSNKLDACFKNEELLRSIQRTQKAAEDHYGIRSTPSFVINENLYTGLPTYRGLSDALNKALKAKGLM